MLNRCAVALAQVVVGTVLSLGTALLPTVGGIAHAQPGCYTESYRAHTILICPVDECQRRGSVLTCASLGRFKQYCATYPGIPPCAPFANPQASSGGGGRGGGQDAGTGGSGAAPTHGVNIDADVKVVKDCADRATPPTAPEHLFNRVAKMGVVTVSYGNARTVIHEGPGRTRIVDPLGNTTWNGGAPRITIDRDRIASDVKETGVRYWNLFADTLIHEYYHAYDMFNCACNDPHNEPGHPWSGSRSGYEDHTTERAAQAAGALAACLAD